MTDDERDGVLDALALVEAMLADDTDAQHVIGLADGRMVHWRRVAAVLARMLATYGSAVHDPAVRAMIRRAFLEQETTHDQEGAPPPSAGALPCPCARCRQGRRRRARWARRNRA